MIQATTANIANTNRQHARDIYLLKHILFIFIVFVIGWAPIYILIAADQNGDVPTWVYLLLELLPVLSVAIDIIDLFMYNHDLRQYLKERLLYCLHFNRN